MAVAIPSNAAASVKMANGVLAGMRGTRTGCYVLREGLLWNPEAGVYCFIVRSGTWYGRRCMAAEEIENADLLKANFDAIDSEIAQAMGAK